MESKIPEEISILENSTVNESSMKPSESFTVLVNDDDDEETIASEIQDYVQEDEAIEEAYKNSDYDIDIVQKSDSNLRLSRTNTGSSEKSVVSVVEADQSNHGYDDIKDNYKISEEVDNAQYNKQQRMQFDEDDDIANLIDNDEDAYEEHSDMVRSPSPRIVNYLTNTETQSSFLRRQRLTTVSTLDLPVVFWNFSVATAT